MIITARDFHLLDTGGDKTPPTEFRIWSYGKVRTTKGEFILTPADASAIVAAANDHGADLMIDYEHLAVRPIDAESGKAAGWFNLEAREDGLWAVNVRWSPPATEMLRNGEYRYFSPAFSVDKKTREIKDLLNVALTNLPATKDLQALVAARRGEHVTIARDRLVPHRQHQRGEAIRLSGSHGT